MKWTMVVGWPVKGELHAEGRSIWKMNRKWISAVVFHVWNHRMACVGRDLKDHLVPSPSIVGAAVGHPVLHFLGNDAGGGDHRIVETLRLDKTSKITKSIHLPMPNMPTEHVPQCHISTFLEYLQGWWLHHFPGQPIPVPHHSFWETHHSAGSAGMLQVKPASFLLLVRV